MSPPLTTTTELVAKCGASGLAKVRRRPVVTLTMPAGLGGDIGGTFTDLIVIIEETTGRSSGHRGARPAERLAPGAR